MAKDKVYPIDFTLNDLIVMWNLTESAEAKGGPMVDALASLRAKLRPSVETASPKK